MRQADLLSTPDSTTESVREFYELYPYPADSTPTLRTGFDARVVLSHGQLTRTAQRPLQILDAGCGRGVGLVAFAATHPEAELVGIDLCRAALEDAGRELEARGLTNTRLQSVDLMTLEGLEVPEGGFDVIHSSGVVHHLSDPALGLRRLGEVLAPHGVISIMLYGTHGRSGIARVARTLALWLDESDPLETRLQSARLLIGTLAEQGESDCPFREAAQVPDAEFVDRYLHPNEVSYDVDELFDLIAAAGLRFLAWSDPTAWSLDSWLPPGPLRDSIEAMPDRERFALIEEISRPASLECYLGRLENSPRQLPPFEEWAGQLFAVHPEVRFEIGTRSLWSNTRLERVSICRSGESRTDVEEGPLAKVAWILSTQNRPFRGLELIEALVEDGWSVEQSSHGLREALRHNWLYRPHEVEITSGSAR